MSAPANQTGPDTPTLLVYVCLYFLVASLFLRLSPGIGVVLFLLGIIGLAAWFGTSWFRKHRSEKPNPNDFGYRIGQRYEDCRRKEERFRTEAEGIRNSIATLRDDIERSSSADAGEVERAQKLITEFEAEFNLRHAKASFFADCAAKLKALLDRHKLQESIIARKKELDALRSTNFDDEAALEETRYHLERDTIELDTIAELSKEAFASFKAEQAEELRLRLEKLRSEL
ncbi:hypothetical protein FUA23_12600 [Neolewinella aurantiaca]|uniref:Uncharacterized protein n=1 Tax=Neolewinella aurantiaca TaxID=2602767 RepID=A0A5C7FRX7_9BACT|nr:hypothetical protein [Neolewinella aurantiaca]TXF88896.1 hypothetical protein FUA23_12600 [Neolewinella aurantiaca]